MTVTGRIIKGAIVPDEALHLPEGSRVRIELTESPASTESQQVDQTETISKTLLRFAGRAKGLPGDGARNHDHYLYGTAKS